LAKVTPQWSEFAHIIVKLNDTTALLRLSKVLYDMAMIESTKREAHVQAILFEQSNMRHNATKILGPTDIHSLSVPNKLPGVPDDMVEDLNTILKGSNCPQYFGITSGEVSFSFLLDCVSPWKDKTSKIDLEIDNMNHGNFISNALIHLDLAHTKALYKLRQFGRLQHFYRKATHLYLLEVNKIGDFANKMLPKSRSSPTTHTKIGDDNLQQSRTCANDEEELVVTQEFHGHWMGNSGAKDICAFAEI